MHQTLRNMISSEGFSELLPCNNMLSFLHSQEIFPPGIGCYLQMISSKSHPISLSNMTNLKFALHGANPVVRIKWLSGIAENWRSETCEVLDTNLIVLALSSVALNPFKQPHVVSTVGFIHGHELNHGRQWRKVGRFTLICSTPSRSTSTGTRSVTHPERTRGRLDKGSKGTRRKYEQGVLDIKVSSCQAW